MNITFKSLQKSHFPLLLKWLKTPHIKAWWDPGLKWTKKLIQEKYGNYVYGYKLENNIPKKIHAFIIEIDKQPIGYIQVYDAYDFHRSVPLKNLPKSLAAFDIFIGQKEYLNKGIGSKVIKLFLESFCKSKYKYIFVDPDHNNIAAIKAYEKAGFKKIEEQLEESKEIWMLMSLE
ncbi:MAG: GNAT family N-acetyltransferase [Gammaproteobacteria bacterium]|jgi:aminoglycoside 6'-N-acetyltransferase